MPPSHTMEYVRLGSSGLKVSKVILGCMSFGSPEWTVGGGTSKWVLDEATSLPLIKHAYDLGIQSWDTANVYSNGESERVLGKAIRHYNLPRENLVIMTKVHGRVSRTAAPDGHKTRAEAEADGYVNQQGLSRKAIFSSVEASLKRLELDYVDLLQCHRFDPDTPIEETMQALHDIVKSGKVRYIGMSSCFAYQFHTMQAYATSHGLTPFISMQNFHNAVYREEEREMLPLCRQFGVGVIPWSPLAMGLLARPLDADKTARNANAFYSQTFTDESAPIIKRIEEIASSRNVSMATVAIAFSLATPGITAPIVGGSKAAHITEAAEAIHFRLTADELESVKKLYKPKAIFGHS